MNKHELDILRILFTKRFVNQRLLSEQSSSSLGIVNHALKNLLQAGLIDDCRQITQKARKLATKLAPKRAVILAAGFGLRMIPLNTELSKGLLKVRGEILIERFIRQLHAVSIREIYVVVGFMKEKYEYLIDKFGVTLVVNPNYKNKNNLHSLNLVRDKLENSYIVPVDLYSIKNPFQRYEFYSWYMISDVVDDESEVRLNRKMELVRTKKNIGGNEMLGIAYLTSADANMLEKRLRDLSSKKHYEQAFWEEALYNGDKMFVLGRVMHAVDIVEINTYEQLREFDQSANQIKNKILLTLTTFFATTSKHIQNIEPIKKGMTNRSFRFSFKENTYIMRLPSSDTNLLINRKREKMVYEKIRPFNISDEVLYLDEEAGYKITRFISTTRSVNPKNKNDIKKCMVFLKKFHALKLKGVPKFDIFKEIEFYESLLDGKASIYKDYLQTKEHVFALKPFVEKYQEDFTLTHIDAVYDNFLFFQKNGKEEILLIDWEYAALFDPHVDIAMFALYALYSKKELDFLIDAYFTEGCTQKIRLKIYAYVAIGGLLWSNWAEYKQSQGIEFGEYAIRQYRYAKDYYRLVEKILAKK